MKKKKIDIAVFVSGGGTNLQALLDAQARGELPSGDIKLVVSDNPDAFALERARNAGVEAICLTRKEHGGQDGFEKALKAELSARGIDLIVLAGFMNILTENFTRDYQRRILNIHPSLIPAFCGKGFYGIKVHEAALAKGVKVTGATVHFVNEIPDGGEIILQKAVNVEENDTPQTLQKRVMEEAEWILLPEAAEKVARAMIADMEE